MARSRKEVDVAIIGGGIAGLSLALRLPRSLRVAVITKGGLGESNTRYAQGGIAAAVGQDDQPELHYEDTLAAGAGLCDQTTVRSLVEEAPEAIRWLIKEGVLFDRGTGSAEQITTADGLLLGREGAHSRWRVLHAGGDATGAEIERVLCKRLRECSQIQVYQETFVTSLLREDGVCVGLEAVSREGEEYELRAGAVVLASGGAGSLWLHTSNPSGATADGIALAWHAGAAVADLEFMQFHPTVLTTDKASFLISEAVRGEGAYLRNHAGERFMPRYSEQSELAARDVVARAILQEMQREGTRHEFLDLRHLPAEQMYARFPTIAEFCRQQGFDFAHDLLPIAPAAHYCMGGVMVDAWSRTSVPGLYAIGEVSCTGVHGANRLASNSLLEGLVFGLRLGDYLAQRPEPVAAEIARKHQFTFYHETIAEEIVLSNQGEECTAQEVRETLRHVMWDEVSLHRSRAGLLHARQVVQRLQYQWDVCALGLQYQELISWRETENMLLAAELVIVAALEREESRGSHWRSDFPTTNIDYTYTIAWQASIDAKNQIGRLWKENLTHV